MKRRDGKLGMATLPLQVLNLVERWDASGSRAGRRLKGT
jgi:hypothetical protein